MKMRSTTWVMLLVGLLITSTIHARRFGTRESRIYLEASQVLTSVIVCAVEIANVHGNEQARAELIECVRDGLHEDVTITTPSGHVLQGADAVVNFFGGVAADQRINATTILNNYLVTKIEPGAIPGTGTIELMVEASAYHDIVSPIGPFGQILGPQFLINRNVALMRAERPGEWKMVEVAILSSVRPQPRPQYEPAP